jgi:hypothetical protein
MRTIRFAPFLAMWLLLARFCLLPPISATAFPPALTSFANDGQSQERIAHNGPFSTILDYD